MTKWPGQKPADSIRGCKPLLQGLFAPGMQQ